MKNKELFDRTVSILVNAYQKDTLEYADCKACAVGNLVCYNNGGKLKKIGTRIENIGGYWSGGWSGLIEIGRGNLKFSSSEFNKRKEKELLNTGYSLYELALIEFTFSKNRPYTAKDPNFVGLMAIVDLLMNIHEANDLEIKEAKSLFVKETA